MNLYVALFCGSMINGEFQMDRRCEIEEAEREQNYLTCYTVQECHDKHGIIFKPMLEDTHERIPR